MIINAQVFAGIREMQIGDIMGMNHTTYYEFQAKLKRNRRLNSGNDNAPIKRAAIVKQFYEQNDTTAMLSVPPLEVVQDHNENTPFDLL